MDYSYSLDSANALQAVMGVLAGFGIVFCIIAVVVIIALWKVFTKAGEKGWKAIIPIYNTYIMFKIAGKSFWKWILIYVGYGICMGIAGAVGGGAISAILAFIAFGLSIWALVELILMFNGLSKNFGHGAGFTVGLVLLTPIFLMILGFGSSQYIGSKS